MTFHDLTSYMESCARLTEKALLDRCGSADDDFGVLYHAMSYSAGGAGKRIRPFLCLSVCDMLGGQREKALLYATAVEMIHTYSLIHDDLPCMDDDDLRRGQPTCHIRFGEANALLAGDALLTKAFMILSESTLLNADEKARAISLLSGAALSMVEGQTMDLKAEKQTDISVGFLQKLQSLKTGALIRVSVALGCLSADGVPGEVAGKLDDYAQKIGLAFQVVDDYLDERGKAAEFGKPIGSDREKGKATFLSVMTPEDAFAYASDLTSQARSALTGIDGNETLILLADYLLTRQK